MAKLGSKKERSASKQQAIPRKKDYIDQFFADYETFDYRPRAPVWEEYRRMCNHFGWRTTRGEPPPIEQKVAEANFKLALVEQFNDIYGKSIYSLGAWRKLCHVLNIDPPPARVEDCRKRVSESHVNLVDLVDSPRTGDPVTIFPDLEALREYTKATGKYFPKNEAYGSLLQYLLRNILGTHNTQPRGNGDVKRKQQRKESSGA
ncbi:hypothetical protein HJFPF1_12222 [Paramyrothecium foliicola]|nr:hypothetical protein HJFPF1_12222 [Paramyrothecium foliicola]